MMDGKARRAGVLNAHLLLAAIGWAPPELVGPPRPKAEAGPQVVSRAKAAMQGKGSDFLRAPGADRYQEDEEWADLPAWRQASFFGVRAKGQFFLYVVDCSGSMVDEDRLARAKEAVRRSVRELREPQRFKVIFYNDEPIAMPGDLPKSADQTSKDQLMNWLRIITPDGGTDPNLAMAIGLSMRPDAVFLLSDGEFPEGTAEAIVRRNPRKVPIHCIDLGSGDTAEQLKKIAAESGGKYVWRPYRGE